MKQLMMQATSGDMEPEELKNSIRDSDSTEIKYRRAIVGVSLLGIAAIGVISLLQMGM